MKGYQNTGYEMAVCVIVVNQNDVYLQKYLKSARSIEAVRGRAKWCTTHRGTRGWLKSGCSNSSIAQASEWELLRDAWHLKVELNVDAHASHIKAVAWVFVLSDAVSYKHAAACRRR